MSFFPALAARGVWRALCPVAKPCFNAGYSAAATSDPGSPTKRAHRTVSTLNPSLIKSTDYLDFSQKATVSIGFTHSGTGDRCRIGRLSYGHLRHRFPPQARGFLYYHYTPRAAPLDGGLRFRYTADNSPLSFPHGQDMVAHDHSGIPWQISLGKLACRAEYASFAEQLLHETLVTEERLKTARRSSLTTS
ncbi:hypothetical protein DFH09DRAFT_1051755 [Mycena vulgaris]|nr:hypothetical protein DFH09DRAFT_1051755 [Mycena vulgaris]